MALDEKGGLHMPYQPPDVRKVPPSTASQPKLKAVPRPKPPLPQEKPQGLLARLVTFVTKLLGRS